MALEYWSEPEKVQELNLEMTNEMNHVVFVSLGICCRSFMETCLWRSVRSVAGTYVVKRLYVDGINICLINGLIWVYFSLFWTRTGSQKFFLKVLHSSFYKCTFHFLWMSHFCQTVNIWCSYKASNRQGLSGQIILHVMQGSPAAVTPATRKLEQKHAFIALCRSSRVCVINCLLGSC